MGNLNGPELSLRETSHACQSIHRFPYPSSFAGSGRVTGIVMSRRHTQKETLGELEQLALLSVLRLGQEAYAARVRRDLDEIADRPLAAATIHVTLVRLERKGYLTSQVTDPAPVRGGRSRRCFTITAAGIEALRNTRAALDRMWERVREQLDLESS